MSDGCGGGMSFGGHLTKQEAKKEAEQKGALSVQKSAA